MKNFIKILTVILIIGIIVALTLGIVLWCTEYKPQEIENLNYNTRGTRGLYSGREINIVEWNIGSAITQRENDSYKEGGKNVEGESANAVYENLLGIAETLNYYDADLYILNDVDFASKKTMNINEALYIGTKLNLTALTSIDKKVKYTPYPWPFEGNTENGSALYSHFGLSSFERVALPYKNAKFPLKLVASKNAASVARIPLSNSNATLVLINANLENTPISTENSRDAVVDALLSLAYKEYNGGKNYVIVSLSANRLLEGKKEINNPTLTLPSKFTVSLENGWTLVCDEENPTTRSLNVPYKGNENKVNKYTTDGYIVSPNVSVNDIETIDEEFFYSAHNPVRIKAVLK